MREDPAVNKPKNGGYTLIELLISMVIFSIGMLGLTALQVDSVNRDSRSGRVTEMSTAASDKIEETLSLDYDHTDLDDGKHTPSQSADGIDNNFDEIIDNPGGESGTLSISWTVTKDSIINDSKTITVTVTLLRPGGSETLSLTQIKARE